MFMQMRLRPSSNQCQFVLVSLWMALASAVMAQPLVTGDLSVYYSFDSFVSEVADLSGSDPPLNGDVYGNVVRDDNDAMRGSSAFIHSAPNFDPEHFIAIGGCDQIENPAACDALPSHRVPSTAYTVAAWVKLQETGGDQSIHQVTSSDGSFAVHAQAQANGELRLHLRGQLPSENIVGIRTGHWEADQWFHYAATYDQPNDAWALYFNGEEIAGGPTNLAAGNVPLGDWGRGSLMGMTPDRNRQAFGHFDEYYIFTRAITPAEVWTLYASVPEPSAATLLTLAALSAWARRRSCL